MNTVKTKSIIRRALSAVLVAGALAVGALAGAMILDETPEDTIILAGLSWD